MTVPPTTAIADVLALFGRDGLVRDDQLDVVCLPHGRVAGPAVTVELVAEPGALTDLYAVASRDLSGAVVVIAGGEDVPGSVWGQIMARAIGRRGAVGALVAGGVRDRGDIASEGVAVWGRRAIAVGPNGGARVRAVDVPVVIGGATIRPGDLVVLDEDGVVVLAAEESDRLLGAARHYDEAEGRVLTDLAAGSPLADAYHHKRDAVAELRPATG